MDMMLLRALILLLIALSVEAAAPVASCSVSRFSGTAPLGVIVDCTATTDADTAKPFHDLVYHHDFGDSVSVGTSTWANGANTNLSKNKAYGPIAAHVFEAAGTFTITSRVTDGVNSRTVTNVITVADPDITYAGTATTCFTNGSDFTGCPAGATQTDSHSDWDAAINAATCNGTTKRCLFKRGDTFAAASNPTITAAGPNTIGAFGSGALPIVNVSTGIPCLRTNSASVNDLRFMDIDCVGTGVTDGGGTETAFRITTGSPSGITILRVTSREMGGLGLALVNGTLTVSNTIVQDSTIYNHRLSTALYAQGTQIALLGNSVGPVAGSGEHLIRTQKFQKSVIAHNTLTSPANTKVHISVRATAHVTTAEDSFYVVVSDNKLLGTADVTPGGLNFETDGVVDQRVYDVIAERNWITHGPYTGATTCSGIGVLATRATIRNNLVDLSAPTTCGRNGVLVKSDGTAPDSDDVNVYNNTLYSSTSATTNGVTVQSTVTNTRIFNILCWFDLGTACVSDSGTDTVTGTNSSTAQTTGTDPSFDTPLTTPSGFRIGTGSYAATGGTVIFPASNYDFYNCDDTTANEHIGAFVSRTRARCR